MAHSNAAVLTRVERYGMGLVQPVRGLEALLFVMGSSATQPLSQVSRAAQPGQIHVHGWAALLLHACCQPPAYPVCPTSSAADHCQPIPV